MKKIGFTIWLSLAWLLTGCESDNPIEPINETSGPISGTVNLFTSAGITAQFNDMTVNIVGTDYTAITNTEGYYNFPSVPFGDYRLEFIKENYGTYYEDVTHNKGFSQFGTQVITLSLGEISKTSIYETIEKIENGDLLIRIVTIPIGTVTNPTYVTIFFGSNVDVSNFNNQAVFGPLTFNSGNAGNVVTIPAEKLANMGFEVGDAVYFIVYGDSYHTNTYQSDSGLAHPNVSVPGSSIMSFVRR